MTKHRTGLPDKQMRIGSIMSFPNAHPHRKMFSAHIKLFSVHTQWCTWNSNEVKFRTPSFTTCISFLPSLDSKSLREGKGRGERGRKVIFRVLLHVGCCWGSTTEQVEPWVWDKAAPKEEPIISPPREKQKQRPLFAETVSCFITATAPQFPIFINQELKEIGFKLQYKEKSCMERPSSSEEL